MEKFTKNLLFIAFLIGVTATFSKADIINGSSISLKVPSIFMLPDSACIASDLFKADTITCYANNPHDYCIHVDISSSVDK